MAGAKRRGMIAVAPASADYQSRIYEHRYTHLRGAYDFFRYDRRYRLPLMEEVFREHAIPFERQRVFELGFGTGSLLLRFDSTSALHGCELSATALSALREDPRVEPYRETRFVACEPDGMPSFPESD